jgi:hypothetical protein
MKNKQYTVLKILCGLIVLTFSVPSLGQNALKLAQADSLFNSKQYTQSVERYEELFQQKVYSPAMLLRMAFIKEGLGNLSESLYYLNLYYLASDDKQALDKIQEIAKRSNLKGYEPTDTKNIQHLIHEYYSLISWSLVSMILLLFSTIVYQKRKSNARPFAASTALVLFIGILFFHINFSKDYQQGIVRDPATYLMSGPSAGSSVVDIIGEGNMLPIIDKQDVWVEVQWRGRTVFVKEHQLLPVRI